MDADTDSDTGSGSASGSDSDPGSASGSAVEGQARQLRERLVDALRSDGLLADPRWLAAFREVPRHLFLPRFFRQGRDGRWNVITADHPQWLTMVYSDHVWVTQLDNDDTAWQHPDHTRGVPTSSSSMPAIMAIMLEALLVPDDGTVLEIGTGTGYNAALLCHALGDDRVTTVEVDPAVHRAALRCLDAAGHHPTCVLGDGSDGVPARAPYDRVLCTCAVSRIPLPWLTQTRPGGLVVTTLNRPIGAGLVRLVVGPDDTALGRVLAEDGRFMPLRADRHTDPGRLLHTVSGAASSRPTDLAVDAVLSPRSPFEFFAGLARPDVQATQPDDHHTWLVHPDGSWVLHRTRRGERRVSQGGPRRLWDLAEHGYQQWRDLGEPRRDRFGLTVTPDRQDLWLDAPDSPHHWPL